MKRKQYRVTTLFISTFASSITTSAFGAGFYLHEHSANGLGRAFAGQAAKPENASVLVDNPAAITTLPDTQISAFVSYVDPGIDVEGNVNFATRNNTTNFAATQDDVSDGEVIPAIFATHKMHNGTSLGLGIFSNFGLSTDFDDNFNALHFGDRAEIKTIVINPSIAFKLSDEVSIGFGINATFAEAELGTSVPNIVSSFTNGLIPALSPIAQMEGDDWGYGWNAGIFWEASNDTNIGLSYRSSTSFDLSGEMSSAISEPLNQRGQLGLDLPAIAEVAFDHSLSDRVSVQVSANWFQWSKFDILTAELENGLNVLIGNEHFENSWKLSFGTTFVLSETWIARAGYAYDEGAATTEHRSLNIPDTDRQWLSAGVTHKFNNALVFDIAVVRVFGREANLTEDSSLGPVSSTLVASQNSSATILSAQVNYTF